MLDALQQPIGRCWRLGSVRGEPPASNFRRGHSAPPLTVWSEGTAWTAAAVSPSEATAALRESASIMRCGARTGSSSARVGGAEWPAETIVHASLFNRGSLLLQTVAARPQFVSGNAFYSCQSGTQQETNAAAAGDPCHLNPAFLGSQSACSHPHMPAVLTTACCSGEHA